MIVTQFHDKNFDFNQPSKVILNVMFGKSGYIYAIFDQNAKKHFCLTECKSDNDSTGIDCFKSDILTQSWLKLPFELVNIIIDTPNFVIEPEKIADSSNESMQTCINTIIGSSKKIFSKKLKTIDANIKFVVEENLLNTCSELFKNVEFYHIGHLLTAENIALSKFSNAEYLYNLYFVDNSFYISITLGGKLILLNKFIINNELDVVYYLSMLLSQYPLENSKKITISGSISPNDKYSSVLSKYSTLKYSKFSLDHLYAFSIDKIEEHKYSLIINHPQCE